MLAGAAMVGVVSLGAERKAEAFVFHDGPAFAQRLAQALVYLNQYYQMTVGIKGQLQAFKDAYEGGKDWRNMGWIDTLKLLDSPWFDSVEGIDGIRATTWTTVMTAEQATKLWQGLDDISKWKANSRYRSDPWYRRKVDSLRKQSDRARATRATLMRQMQAQNRQLVEDVKKVKKVRDQIDAESKKNPINHARIASLQGELAAVQARYQGENLMLKNQQAIMFLVGEDNAYRVFLETMESDWIDGNSKAVRDFGKGFSK